MSDQSDIKLNEFGDLSRRQRRELEAQGINPDTAVIEFLNTQSIPVQRPAEAEQPAAVSPPEPLTAPASVPLRAPASALPTPPTPPVPPVAPPQPVPSAEVPRADDPSTGVPVVTLDLPTTTAEIFPAMSKREVRQVLDRQNDDDVVVAQNNFTVEPNLDRIGVVSTPPAPADPFSELIRGAVNQVDQGTNGTNGMSGTSRPAVASSVAPPAPPTIEPSTIEPAALQPPAPAPQTSAPATPEVLTELGASVGSTLPQAELPAVDPQIRRGRRASGAITDSGSDAPIAGAEVVHDAREELVVEVDSSAAVVENETWEESAPTTIAEVTAAAALEQAIAAHNAARLDNGFDDDSYEQFSGPSTGSIPTISNALILPTLPEDTGTIIPVIATGEIIITEQIILPSSIAQVGAEAGTLDTSDIDIIPDGEEVVPSQDLAPVRASKAVSSYNANSTMVKVPKRASDRLPLVLSLTAGGLAIAVVGLFVAGYFLGIF